MRVIPIIVKGITGHAGYVFKMQPIIIRLNYVNKILYEQLDRVFTKIDRK